MRVRLAVVSLLAGLVPPTAPGIERFAAIVNGIPIIAVGSLCAVTFPAEANPPVVAALGERYRCLTPDLRGHGSRSEATPVSLPADAPGAPPPDGLPDGYRFLFAFDYLSVFERKNPIAVVEAFRRAFVPGSGAALIVKTLNHDYAPDAHQRLRAAAAGHPNVHLIERRLSRAERDGLMNAANCYVSLHRAEGFGYTLAEAMWLGKPVVATGYSGNLDFMTAENSYPVDYRLVPIGPGCDPYPADGVWADPDIAHAARLMREVFDHPEERARRGARAAAVAASNSRTPGERYCGSCIASPIRS